MLYKLYQTHPTGECVCIKCVMSLLSLLKEAGPYSNWLGHTQKAAPYSSMVWCSRLGNTQNLGISEFPKVFRSPFYPPGPSALIFLVHICHVCDIHSLNEVTNKNYYAFFYSNKSAVITIISHYITLL